VNIKLATLLALITPATPIFAHPGHDESPTWALAQLNGSRGSPTSPTESRVMIVTNAGDRVITANGLPDHAPGQFPNPGNPNRISAQKYTFRLTLRPQMNRTPRPAQGAWFGVALNGVPFEPGTGEFWNGRREWNYEAMSGLIDLGLDVNNAHVQPTGAYHYHGLPIGLMSKLGKEGATMLLVGYAADGFPIYTSYAPSTATDANSPLKKMRSSWQLKQGSRPGGPTGDYDGRFTADYEFVRGSGDLDECNGRFGVTPEYPEGIYYYCITAEFPGLARSWRGTPDQSFFKSRPGPGGLRGGGGRQPFDRRIPGAPPPAQSPRG
jgi:hypothetical protein